MKFGKGQSGNPKGRPKGSLNLPEVRKMLAPHASTFEATLLELLEHDDVRARIEALKIGMAYLWGKPLESVEHRAGADGGGGVKFEFVLSHEEKRASPEPDVANRSTRNPGIDAEPVGQSSGELVSLSPPKARA